MCLVDVGLIAVVTSSQCGSSQALSSRRALAADHRTRIQGIQTDTLVDRGVSLPNPA